MKGDFLASEPNLTFTEKLWQINWGLIMLLCAVASVGFAMLFSAANGHFDPWASRQMVRFGAGIGIMIAVGLVDTRFWMRIAYPGYLVTFIWEAKKPNQAIEIWMEHNGKQKQRLFDPFTQVDESSTRFVQVGGHAARLQAVIGGRADATLINTVTALKGVQEGKVTVLTKLSAEFPGLGYIWSVVRAESLDKPDMAAAFQILTEGSIRGSRYIMENPDDAAGRHRGRDLGTERRRHRSEPAETVHGPPRHRHLRRAARARRRGH